MSFWCDFSFSIFRFLLLLFTGIRFHFFGSFLISLRCYIYSNEASKYVQQNVLIIHSWIEKKKGRFLGFFSLENINWMRKLFFYSQLKFHNVHFLSSNILFARNFYWVHFPSNKLLLTTRKRREKKNQKQTQVICRFSLSITIFDGNSCKWSGFGFDKLRHKRNEVKPIFGHFFLIQITVKMSSALRRKQILFCFV